MEPLIERVLPDGVVAVETDEELIDTELFPEEAASVERAVEKRRREFVTGRALARRALERLGVSGSVPIGSGERGEPLWPSGVVGSITHCRGYRACAVARAEAIASLGIDAEPNEPLPDGVLPRVASPVEVERLRTGGIAERVLFCAKEAVYKAWFPLAGSWLGFEDVDMTFDAGEQAFRARLLVPGPAVDGAPLTDFHGRWLASDGIVVAAVVVPRS
jgi:4'-phosphopantetheinyl transferase EntD